MPNPWFKFYGPEYLADPKIKSMSTAERSCWVTLLSFASGSPTPGIVRFLDESALMRDAGVDFQKEEWPETIGVLNLFQNMEMIHIDNETITVLNWNKRQERALTPYERVKKYREKKRNDNAYDKETITIELEEDRDIEEDNTNTSSSSDDDVYQAPGFKEFWDAYPKKKGKGQALKTWKKLKPSKKLQERILASVMEHSKDVQWTKDDGQFIPHPSTWLNGRRFDDEVQVTSGRQADKF